MKTAPKLNDKWYRVDRILYHACDCDDACHHPARPAMHVTTFYVQKVTPKGVWLSLIPDCDGEVVPRRDVRWVGFESTKRYACPTRLTAYEAFLARKLAQKRILERNMYYTEKLLKLCEEKIKEVAR